MELYRSDYVVNGRTGFLIQSDAELSARLDQLAGDAALRRSFARAAIQHARQFDWDKIAGQWAAVFERAWQKRRPCVQQKYLEHLPARGGATMKRTSALVRYGGFFLSVGTARVLGLLITSLTFPILVRRLGVETYGLWSYVVALCAFFDVVANPGLTTHIAQQVAARRHAAAELVTDFLALRSLSSLVAMMALLVVARFEARPEARHLLQWYGVAELCVGLTGTDFLLSSLELFHIRSVMSLTQQALYGAGVLLLVRSPKDILWLPASILGSALATNLAGWVVLWSKGFRPSLKISPGRWPAIMGPSLHYAATT